MSSKKALTASTILVPITCLLVLILFLYTPSHLPPQRKSQQHYHQSATIASRGELGKFLDQEILTVGAEVGIVDAGWFAYETLYKWSRCKRYYIIDRDIDATEESIRKKYPQLRAFLAKVHFMPDYNLTTKLDYVYLNRHDSKEALEEYWDALIPSGILAGDLRTSWFEWMSCMGRSSVRNVVGKFAYKHNAAVNITSDGLMWIIRRPEITI
ncbi:hypothetical protein SeMB42_g02333 [Synchytrium endobioticum]|uniref:S-adenosyl-L-methionine-dependent methyltransferase n=1 Tax=Synchytrium endobioticum TaxID=286115 RepID=A0A507D5B7_9FUNG|nr:hypothetical protein SeLEV6574_g03123 [Synchytrium endobioticum]TPX50220.1 hypothetical protein SeMB42_g02333 [Synchytrium endobioticum]